MAEPKKKKTEKKPVEATDVDRVTANVVAEDVEVSVAEVVAVEAEIDEAVAQGTITPEEGPEAAEAIEEAAVELIAEEIVEAAVLEEAIEEAAEDAIVEAAVLEEAIEEAAVEEIVAEQPSVPAPQSGPKLKKKRLPRSLRPQKTRPTRTKPTERKSIVRLDKPEHERGRSQERLGTVVSDAMDKTIVVKVDVIKAHRKYKKVVRRSTKFHAHDEGNTAKVGDTVRIVETRPLSATKRWRLTEIVEVAK